MRMSAPGACTRWKRFLVNLERSRAQVFHRVHQRCLRRHKGSGREHKKQAQESFDEKTRDESPRLRTSSSVPAPSLLEARIFHTPRHLPNLRREAACRRLRGRASQAGRCRGRIRAISSARPNGQSGPADRGSPRQSHPKREKNRTSKTLDSVLLLCDIENPTLALASMGHPASFPFP
jgi:hypothetical protein